jgi:alkanesulfonate monooxygenase SsuD/methylene tetrahydromethanopterin reductase-like flavin-dependent oxidoreductase (luciferase family)
MTSATRHSGARPPTTSTAKFLDQIAWSENNGFDDVCLSEHHFIEDGYLPSILPAAAAIAARTTRIRIASGVLSMPFHNPLLHA